MQEIIYSVIVPVYNEELVINPSYKRLKKVMNESNENYEIIFVNDGSVDRSMELLEYISGLDNKVKVVNFSRNFGHQAAITAGMNYAKGKAIIVIDADLQDPPEVILQMIDKWKEGYDVVYGKRAERKGETLFKKITAKAFYRTLDSLTDVKIPVDVGDFRLIDRKVCDALNSLPEKNRYVRGLVSWVGYKQTAVEFVREERFAGETKYPLKKMLKFAMDGITSFSYKPLKLATYLGAITSFSSFIYLIVVVCLKLFTDSTIQGWTSLIGLICLFNGIILIILGIIGEYIGRIYDESKGRPLYMVGELKGFKEKSEINEYTSFQAKKIS